MTPNSTAVGVDWGTKGWVCAALNDGEWSVSLEPSFLGVWRRYGGPDGPPILVDIPIGLPSKGTRKCDLDARKYLSAGSQRVFLTPPRSVLQSPTYDEAKEETKRLTDHSLTTQAWSLLPCIQAVDDVLAAINVNEGVREAHPEVCFGKLGGTTGVATSKQSQLGVDERKRILQEHVPGTAAAYETLVSTHIGDLKPHARRFRASNRDDILDAMALAVTAHLGREGFERFGGADDPHRDVPMEIVYTTGT